MLTVIVPLAGGFLLDLCLGDPPWLFHPIRLIGWWIDRLERLMRRLFPATPRGELGAGVCLALGVILAATALPWLLLWAVGLIHPALRTVLALIMCYQLLAMKSLRVESMKVYAALIQGDLPLARQRVAMIVGRDTEHLTASQVAKAAVETVAENTSDGVIAPLLFMTIGGAPLGFFYKAVNTMDSMIGYQNDRYLYLGRFAAKLDDVLNYIPARIAAWAMIAAAWISGMDGRNAGRIYRRDRKNHASPNSAQTEAACAGALRVQLAGDATYFGQRLAKPTIGDDLRPVEPQDIGRANRLMLMTSCLCLLVFLAARIGLELWWR